MRIAFSVQISKIQLDIRDLRLKTRRYRPCSPGHDSCTPQKHARNTLFFSCRFCTPCLLLLRPPTFSCTELRQKLPFPTEAVVLGWSWCERLWEGHFLRFSANLSLAGTISWISSKFVPCRDKFLDFQQICPSPGQFPRFSGNLSLPGTFSWIRRKFVPRRDNFFGFQEICPSPGQFRRFSGNLSLAGTFSSIFRKFVPRRHIFVDFQRKCPSEGQIC